MSRIALAVALSLIGGSAFAAERAGSTEPRCGAIADIKAAMPDAKFTVMAPGQVHFLWGLFAGSPITPPGNPPGDGALLAEFNGRSAVLWTKGNKQACLTPILTDPEHNKGSYMPLPLNPEILARLKSIKSGKDEAVMTGHDDPSEMHL